MKVLKEKIKVIDKYRGYFECRNYCDECKARSGECRLMNEVMEESK